MPRIGKQKPDVGVAHCLEDAFRWKTGRLRRLSGLLEGQPRSIEAVANRGVKRSFFVPNSWNK
jgi:hypothetical protein